jgi:hypothetical protein
LRDTTWNDRCAVTFDRPIQGLCVGDEGYFAIIYIFIAFLVHEHPSVIQIASHQVFKVLFASLTSSRFLIQLVRIEVFPIVGHLLNFLLNNVSLFFFFGLLFVEGTSIIV